jgi:hypothetical protein
MATIDTVIAVFANHQDAETAVKNMQGSIRTDA